jgi:hypothetical protein
VTIPFQGLQQGPADGWHWFDQRNEFLFHIKHSKLLVAGDTLFFEKCNIAAPDGQITFNPQGDASKLFVCLFIYLFIYFSDMQFIIRNSLQFELIL